MVRTHFFVIGIAAALASCTAGMGPGSDGGETGTGGNVPPLPACSSDADCGGDTCCDDGCANTAFNATNCGGCGIACAPGEVCLNQQCQATSFAGACNALGILNVSNGLPNDEAAGSTIATALTRACPGLSVTSVSQDDPNVVDGNGFPVPGAGDLLVVPGGGFVSRITGAMENARASGIYFSGDNNQGGFYRSSDGSQVVTFPISEIHDEHDFFAVQLYPDPAGGQMVLTAYGVREWGTSAAARWLSDVVANNLGAHQNRWYVVEWTDENGDGEPNAGDTFAQRGTGN